LLNTLHGHTFVQSSFFKRRFLAKESALFFRAPPKPVESGIQSVPEPSMNPVTILYFGDLMAKLSIGRETLRLPPSIKDVAGLMKVLATRGGDWQAAFGAMRSTLRITINKKDADPASALQGGDEIAFIESVSL
jgi:molybdopterin synthase sulfur carrier subunit